MPVTQLDKGNAFRALHHDREPLSSPTPGTPDRRASWQVWVFRPSPHRVGHRPTSTADATTGLPASRRWRTRAIVRRHGSPRLGGSRERVRRDAARGGRNVSVRQQPSGLVGATIEDMPPGPGKDKLPLDIGEATERVAAAVEATRKLGFPFLLTARAEGFLHGNADLDEAIRRLQAYEKAGADVLMAPGLPDLNAVKAVCAAVAKPFNFMVGVPGRSFSVAELEAAGVRRISLAASPLSRRDGRARRGGAGERRKRGRLSMSTPGCRLRSLTDTCWHEERFTPRRRRARRRPSR